MKRYRPIFLNDQESDSFDDVVLLNNFYLIVDEYLIHIYSEPEIKKQKSTKLLEQTRKNLYGIYSAIEHQPHTHPQGQYHLHFFQKNNQLFAINRDGSAHDQSHGFRIPNKAYQAIKDYYPKCNLPKNKIIESFSNIKDNFQILFG